MEQRGTRLRIQLIMGAEILNMTRSRNTVAEITGSVYPEQVEQTCVKTKLVTVVLL